MSQISWLLENVFPISAEIKSRLKGNHFLKNGSKFHVVPTTRFPPNFASWSCKYLGRNYKWYFGFPASFSFHHILIIDTASKNKQTNKNWPKMHCVLKARCLRQQCKYIAFSLHKRVDKFFIYPYTYFIWDFNGVSLRNLRVYNARCSENC